MEKLLKDLKIGEEGIVKRVGGDGAVRRRLFDMGVTPGAPVKMRKLAPLGDPVEVTLRGYELTLRKNEAEWVFVDTVSE
ncbi:MAG TPA: ferrous iron transport protein A [Candidatus Caccalectryoclostridium excrementigallinarum]|uniref:Ferrous iron transport protein A n=1 Tax=Candidatus Caccalectryoclostridium excrementigallinarum TaxID=2840710 RepID=A0A9D1SK29_9FIRM|nr:ferrous iron transport protein A [Candidatus Caccalectryoclostridium excrementigallinarum]